MASQMRVRVEGVCVHTRELLERALEVLTAATSRTAALEARGVRKVALEGVSESEERGLVEERVETMTGKI